MLTFKSDRTLEGHCMNIEARYVEELCTGGRSTGAYSDDQPWITSRQVTPTQRIFGRARKITN